MCNTGMPFNLDTYHFFMLEIFKIQRAVLKYLVKACQPQLSPRAIKISSYTPIQLQLYIKEHPLAGFFLCVLTRLC